MSAGQSDRVTVLERQNEELRRVIRHMRRDIETLGNQEQPASTALADQLPTATADPLSLANADNGMFYLYLQCESKKYPLRFSDIFSQTVGNF